MKKRIILLLLIFLSIFIVRSVSAKEVNVSIKNIEVVEKNNTEVDGKLEFDGLELKSNIKFYDVGDYIKYKVTLKNDDKKDYQIKDITDNNTNENMTFEYEGKDKIIKAGKEESFIVTVTYTKHITNDITKLSNNIYGENQEVKISLKLNEYFSLINPTTGRNVILIILSLIMLVVVLDYVIKNKRVKTMVVILFLLLSVTKMVKADEVITVNFTIKQENEVKISFMDRNWKDIDTGDFTKIEFVKIDKDKSGAYDISEVKDRSIIEWVDNGTLYIGSYHNVYAPVDSTYLFSKYTGYDEDSSTTQSLRMENITRIEFDNRLMTNYTTTMLCMFLGCESFEELNLSNFNTSNAVDMAAMVCGCQSLTNLNMSSFDFSKCHVSSLMMYVSGGGFASLKKLDLSDVIFPENMNYGLGGLSTVEKIILTDCDTSNVTNMGSMFLGCQSLKELNLSSFNTSNVTSFNTMFYNCSSLISLDVSSFDSSNVTNMSGMFLSCSSLTSLDVGSFDTSNVRIMSGMFLNCSSLTSLDLSGFDTSNVTNFNTMFLDCISLYELDLSSFDTLNATIMSRMFEGCNKLKTIKVSNQFGVSQVTSSENMFGGCTSLVGGNGIVYDENHIDKEYARIDVSGTPGYFTKG